MSGNDYEEDDEFYDEDEGHLSMTDPGDEIPSLRILCLNAIQPVAVNVETSASEMYMMEWVVRARAAVRTIQNFYWRHIYLRKLSLLFTGLATGTRFEFPFCGICRIRRTMDRCEMTSQEPPNTCFVTCDRCKTMYPNHPKAMGTHWCEHERETLEACYHHKGVCDGSIHRFRGFLLQR